MIMNMQELVSLCMGLNMMKALVILELELQNQFPLQGKYDDSDSRNRNTHFLQWVYCDFGTVVNINI